MVCSAYLKVTPVFEAMRGIGFSHRSASRRGAIFIQGFIFALLLAVASLTVEAQTPKPVQPEGYGSSSNPYKIKAAENLLSVGARAARSRPPSKRLPRPRS